MRSYWRIAMSKRTFLLTLAGLACFILGTNYGCRHFVIPGYQTLYQKYPTYSSVTDLSVESAKFTRDRRLIALHKCCAKGKENTKKYTASSQNLPLDFFRTVIVDRKHRFLYCFAPKVASTNMRRFVLALQGRTKNPNAIQQFDRRGFEFLYDVNASERDEMIRTYFKFMFVRHPLERLVSTYRHRVIGPRTDLHKFYAENIVKKYRKLDGSSKKQLRGDDVTFREFIRYLIDRNNHRTDAHWRPLFDLCLPCLIPYDFIGSIENIGLDVTSLLGKLNVSRKIRFPEKQKYYQTLSRDDALLYYRNVTQRELDILRKKYEKDFECFGYSREFQIHAIPPETY